MCFAEKGDIRAPLLSGETDSEEVPVPPVDFHKHNGFCDVLADAWSLILGKILFLFQLTSAHICRLYSTHQNMPISYFGV